MDAAELPPRAPSHRAALALRHHAGRRQPNVVPSLASVWYYFRELDYAHIQALFETGNAIAKAAAAMTETTVDWRILGAACRSTSTNRWPRRCTRNMKVVGMPSWSAADQALAKGVQRELKAEEKGLETEVGKLEPPPEQLKAVAPTTSATSAGTSPP